MKIKDVQQCSFQNWYYDFEKITAKSIILPLPSGFPEYILKDGIVLPQSSFSQGDPNSSDESDSETDWQHSNSEEAEPPHFPDFDDQIKMAINELGGRIFPKLNWSSPRDAARIAFKYSCCCSSVSDIYLLLKSSDFIVHDLIKAFQDCEDYVQNENESYSLSQPSENFFLILRKWIEIDTAGEFRCFVKNNNLIGISQRETSLYFDHIGTDRSIIIEDILTFFKENIQFKFPSSDYVFDVYREKEKKVQLLDFNPFGIVTDSLLFSWEKLDEQSEMHNEIPAFHFVEENRGVQPSQLSYPALPQDIIDIFTGEDSLKLVDLMKMKIDEQHSSSSDEEDKVDK